MLLSRLQSLLAEIYSVDVGYDVYDFLVTDQMLVRALDRGGRHVEEKLLIAEAAGRDPEVSLYLEQRLLDRLESNDPTDGLNDDNLRDFWTALEGVSHFTYYAWNAAVEKSVTLMEMELQAEVDKFISTLLLLQQQGMPSPRLHSWLFELPGFDRRLSVGELARYRDANRFAGKYCLRLEPLLTDGLAGEELRRELRRFYRLPQADKIQHIEAG